MSLRFFAQIKSFKLYCLILLSLIINFLSQNAFSIQTVKLRPHVRVSPLQFQSIPLKTLRPDIQESIIFSDRKHFLRAPCVLAEDHRYKYAGRCNMIFVKGLGERFQEYKIYREGKCYYHPCTDEFLGFEAIQVGNAALQPCLKCPQEPSKLQVTYAYERITPKDHIFPSFFSSLPDVLFAKRCNAKCQDGFILSVRDEYTQIGPKQIVVVSMGEREGIEVGSVLEIFRREKTRPEPFWGYKDRCELWSPCDRDFCDHGCPHCLPCQYLGCLIIYQTSLKMSLGIILKAEEEISLLDWVVTP